MQNADEWAKPKLYDIHKSTIKPQNLRIITQKKHNEILKQAIYIHEPLVIIMKYQVQLLRKVI